MGDHMGAGIIIVKNFAGDWRVLALEATLEIQARNGGGLDIPKGRQDKGETVWQCATRETFEETSIVIGDHHVVDGPYREGWLSVWLCEFDAHEPILYPNPHSGNYEHVDYYWLPFSSMIRECYPYLRPFIFWASKVMNNR
tara:strand:+ start:370 stop:792 length:423 start_codon:yes stop_codon:yes gene_type:complete